MKRLIVLFLLCLPAFGSIAFDAVSSGHATASPLTVSHTVGGGANTILIVGTAVNSGSGVGHLAGVTYSGVAMTRIRGQQESGDGNWAELWYLVAPPAGTHDIVATAGGTGTAWDLVAISLTGVDQTSPVDASGGTSTNGTSQSITLTTVADNAWIFDFATGNHAWSSYGAGQTDNAHLGRSESSRKGPVTPAGSITDTVNFTGTQQGAYVMASFKPAAGTAKTCTLAATGAGPC